MPTIVYKLGGSLLDLPDLGARVRRVFAQQPDTRPLVVVGGGAAADLVREWDGIHRLGDERAHWLALRSMMLGEALVLELLPDARRVAGRDEAECVWSSGGVPVLCAHDFVRAEEPCPDLPLPHTWEVTSDSIAAWIALRWPADELVLLKSVPPPAAPRPGADDGSIDPHFRRLVPQLAGVGWVNLRSDVPRIEP